MKVFIHLKEATSYSSYTKLVVNVDAIQSFRNENSDVIRSATNARGYVTFTNGKSIFTVESGEEIQTAIERAVNKAYTHFGACIGSELRHNGVGIS
jgi:hypothetical protein